MKNKNVLIIGSLILIVGGYIAYKKFFSKSNIDSDVTSIVNEIEAMSKEAVSLWEKKDYANAIQKSEKGIQTINDYLAAYPDNINLSNKLDGARLAFKTVIFDSTKNIK